MNIWDRLLNDAKNFGDPHANVSMGDRFEWADDCREATERGMALETLLREALPFIGYEANCEDLIDRVQELLQEAPGDASAKSST